MRVREKSRDRADTSAKALACYGTFLPASNQMLIRFVSGQPVSQKTCDYLSWLVDSVTQQAQAMTQSLQVLVLFWDNASWHISRQVKEWIRTHNRRAKKEGTLRLLVCALPVKSPWLNRIEPKWVHAKRAVLEPTRVVSASELVKRVCDYYGCENLPVIEQASQ